MDFSVSIAKSSLLQAFARLKSVPISKVVRNASKDFAQAALKSTPLAKKSKSEYYRFKGKDNEWHYLHESQVAGRKSKSGLKRVRILKGWSKGSWLGVFRALGMSMKERKRLPSRVEHISHAIQKTSQTTATTTITDHIHFDNFGKGNDTRTEAIARAGFELAAKRIVSETNRMLARQWSNQ